MATTSPWPTESELDIAYGDWYRPAEGRFPVGDVLLRRTRGALARRLARRVPAGTILDVGAGDGSLVGALRRRGREAVGLERGHVLAPGVHAGELADLEGEWAAVVFWHALEHLPDPSAAVEHAAALLAPGGLLVIAVPNSASWQARLFADRWLALDLPRHLVHLTAPALTVRLRELGLRVERVSYLRGGQVFFGWAHGLVATLPGGLDLYSAVRRGDARDVPMGHVRQLASLAAAVVATPFALIAGWAEIAARSGGTVYVEARR